MNDERMNDTIQSEVIDLQRLQEITRLLEEGNGSLMRRMEGIVELLPSLCLKGACCRLSLGSVEIRSRGFVETPWHRLYDIHVGQGRMGSLEICSVPTSCQQGSWRPEPEQDEFVVALAQGIGQILEQENTGRARQGEWKAWSDEEVSGMVREVGHDLSNLLMGIAGHLDLTLMDAEGLSGLAARLAEILNMARRGSELCRLLSSCLGEREKSPSVRLSEIAVECAGLARTSFCQRGSVRCEIETGTREVAQASRVKVMILLLVMTVWDVVCRRSGKMVLRTGLSTQTTTAGGLSASEREMGYLDVLAESRAVDQEEGFLDRSPVARQCRPGCEQWMNVLLDEARVCGGSLEAFHRLGCVAGVRINVPVLSGPERDGPITLETRKEKPVKVPYASREGNPRTGDVILCQGGDHDGLSC